MDGSMLEVHDPGEVTVVGFRGEKFLGAMAVQTCRRELKRIVDEHRPKVIQFDLTGVVLITSEMLNFLVSLRKQGLDIALYNPSEDVRAVMDITRLDTVFELTDDGQPQGGPA